MAPPKPTRAAPAPTPAPASLATRAWIGLEAASVSNRASMASQVVDECLSTLHTVASMVKVAHMRTKLAHNPAGPSKKRQMAANNKCRSARISKLNKTISVMMMEIANQLPSVSPIPAIMRSELEETMMALIQIRMRTMMKIYSKMITRLSLLLML